MSPMKKDPRNPLLELKDFGESIWYDNIRRALLTSGEFKRMMAEYGITGVTSNPTIFEKAVSGGTEYDGVIAALVQKGLSEKEMLDELTTGDIRLVADLLMPVYRATEGYDGYVSIEVSPKLAHDAPATVKEAEYLRSIVNRENIMVKVPATVEGISAIEDLTYEGYNINVTLLFSIGRYEDVAHAYLRGLERRVKEGKPVDKVLGAASFFVSRVDTLADRIIEQRLEKAISNDEKSRLEAIKGKVAVANAKLAYEKYMEVFDGERFLKLKARGARPQRLLFGSTGTKNPLYSDIKYVEELVAKDVINTMPLQTLTAFHDHGTVGATLEEGIEQAKRVMKELEGLGIDYTFITDKLEEEGVKTFSDSLDALALCISKKLTALKTGAPPAVEFALPGLDGRLKEALGSLDAEEFSRRLWEKDPTLWSKTPEVERQIKNSLGWLALPKMMGAHTGAILSFAQEIKLSFTDVVLLGMGGSSLAPLVLGETFGNSEGCPRLRVLDSTDPDAVRFVSKEIGLEKTLFIISSKSGTTIEPLSLFEYFYAMLKARAGEGAGANFVAITDPGTTLEGFSRKYSFRHLFLNPPDIGGRFSALSYFGLVPAALAGIDISKLLYYASRMEAEAHPSVKASENPGLSLGAALGEFYRYGRDKITFFLSKEVASFGLWIEQLMAESTGKAGKGLVPVVGEPIRKARNYSNDRAFVYIGVGSKPDNIAKGLEALSKAGHPVISFTLNDPYELGGEFFRWEIATAVAGRIIGINPFDQPDVELSKKLTITRLERSGKKGIALKGLPGGLTFESRGYKVFFGKNASVRIKERFKAGGKKMAKKAASSAKAAIRKTLHEFLALAGEGGYLAVLAYHNPFDKSAETTLAGLRKTLMGKTKGVTLSGWGPRYLHSTGQLHKGGAENGAFIILAHSTKEEIPIPGSRFGFSALELSQALGDMEALDLKGRSAVLFVLKDSSRATLADAAALIKDAAGKKS